MAGHPLQAPFDLRKANLGGSPQSRFLLNDAETVEIPSEEAIMNEVNQELTMENGEIIKVDSDSDSESCETENPES